jgi:hypothetical protein
MILSQGRAGREEEAMTAAAAAAKGRDEVEKEKVEGGSRPIEGAILSLLLLQQLAARATAGLVREAREDTKARRGSELLRIERI